MKPKTVGYPRPKPRPAPKKEQHIGTAGRSPKKR